MALNGSGSEIDPWRITTIEEFLVVVRDGPSSGYYRVVAGIDDGVYRALDPASIGLVSGYQHKVIDLNGFTVRLSATVTTLALGLFGSTFFKRGRFILNYPPQNGSGLTLFFRCGLEDCGVYLYAFSSSTSADLKIIDTAAGVVGLEPLLLKRTIFASGGGGGTLDYVYTPTLTTSGLQISHAYVNSAKAVWSSAGIALQTDMTLPALDALTGTAFTDAGWWVEGAYLLPYQTDAVGLTVLSRNAGENVSRRLWIESSNRLRFLGETDVEGAGSFSERVLKKASFTLVADEQLGVDELADYKPIGQGLMYLPPASNGFVYSSDSAGRLSSLAGIVFDDQPVSIDGIVFTPRPHYSGAISDRLSVARQGLSQTVILDNAAGGGGGGPVLDGDPAYLDGVVEEIHPMLGTVRALANAEVLAFERRGAEYVAMGSAYSNAVGEFRVETEVYGGGDIFAFAADFPGVIWQAAIELNTGDRVRPTVNNGYVYEVITPGNSGATEPLWWADAGDGTEGAIGGATAKARPYYQPVGHGPLKMTLVE